VQRESFATRSYVFRSWDGLDKRIAAEGIDLIERDDEDKPYGMRIELSDRVWLLKSSAANSSMFISLSLTGAETLNCTSLRSRFGRNCLRQQSRTKTLIEAGLNPDIQTLMHLSETIGRPILVSWLQISQLCV
jgi:hypothetical protein